MSISEILKTHDCALRFMWQNQGLQFAIWKTEKQQVSVSFYRLCPASSST